MKKIILLLSLIALIISIAWVFKSGFSHEPLIVMITGIAGIIGHFAIPNSKKNDDTKVSQSITGGNQEVNVNVNLGNKPHKHNQASHEEKAIQKISRDEIIEIMKPKLKILFIDDDTKFNVVKILKDSGWKGTKTVIDIKGIDTRRVKEADIYFVDINGVGKILDCKDEGLDLALMLKQRYPNKKVVIYSANSKNNIFHEAWEKCDFKLEKNALPYQFQSLVEQYSVENYTNNSKK